MNLLPSWMSLSSVDIWTVTLSLSAFVVTWWVWSRVTNKLPPGPTPLPILGNFLAIMRQPLWSYEYFHKLGEQYGGLLTIYLGPTPVVIVNGLEAMKKVFLNHSRVFAGRPKSLSTDLFSENGKDVVFGQYGPMWNIHRGLLTTALHKFATRSEKLPEIVHENVSDICAAMVKSEKPFHPSTMLYNIVYNIISGVCFSKHFELDDPVFLDIMKETQELNAAIGSGLLGDFLPSLAWLPTPGKSMCKKFSKKSGVFLQSFIDEHRSTFDRDNIRDMLDAIILAHMEAEEAGIEDVSFFTDVHLRQTVNDIFFAGTDTTTFSLLWAIAYAVKYPEIQEKMQKEIDEKVGRNVMLTSHHRSHLPYTEAFVLEAMRIRPMAPLSLLHIPIETVQLDGYTIPQGTVTVPNLWSCHHEARTWPEPEKFRPERFLDASGEKINLKATKASNGFVNFSMGKRACPGEQLGRMDTFFVLAGLLQKLTFSLSDEWQDKDVVEKIGGAFVLIPPQYTIIATPR